ncbi:MAG: hypothetical protein ACJAS9_003446 [Polaribacter sp.]|jgi:hypothetical protein
MKISQTQFGLLVWLANGNLLEVCSDLGIYKGKTNGLHVFNGRCSKRTMQRLETEKLVYTTTVHYFGVGWQRYFVSSKGFRFIEHALKQFNEVVQHA